MEEGLTITIKDDASQAEARQAFKDAMKKYRLISDSDYIVDDIFDAVNMHGYHITVGEL